MPLDASDHLREAAKHLQRAAELTPSKEHKAAFAGSAAVCRERHQILDNEESGVVLKSQAGGPMHRPAQPTGISTTKVGAGAKAGAMAKDAGALAAGWALDAGAKAMEAGAKAGAMVKDTGATLVATSASVATKAGQVTMGAGAKAGSLVMDAGAAAGGAAIGAGASVRAVADNGAKFNEVTAHAFKGAGEGLKGLVPPGLPAGSTGTASSASPGQGKKLWGP